jgi:hypothetical protein
VTIPYVGGRAKWLSEKTERVRTGPSEALIRSPSGVRASRRPEGMFHAVNFVQLHDRLHLSQGFDLSTVGRLAGSGILGLKFEDAPGSCSLPQSSVNSRFT